MGWEFGGSASLRLRPRCPSSRAAYDFLPESDVATLRLRAGELLPPETSLAAALPHRGGKAMAWMGRTTRGAGCRMATSNYSDGTCGIRSPLLEHILHSTS